MIQNEKTVIYIHLDILPAFISHSSSDLFSLDGNTSGLAEALQLCAYFLWS